MNAKLLPLMGRYAMVTAAALAWVLSMGAASAQHYSLNALGYADANWVAGSNLVANPFNADPNTISNVLRGLPDGSFFIHWSLALGYAPTNFYSQATGWSDPEAIFTTLDTGFLVLPAPAKMSFVGEVPMGNGTIYCARNNLQLWPVLPPEDPYSRQIAKGTYLWKWDAALQQWGWPYVYVDYTPEGGGAGWVPVGVIELLIYPHILNPPPLEIAPTEAFQIFSVEPWMWSVRSSRTYDRRNAYVPVQGGFPSWARGGTDLSFAIPANDTNGAGMSFTNWSMVRSTNLSVSVWEVVQTGLTATNTATSVSVTTGTNDAAFYRLLPFLPSVTATLLNGSRSGTRFSFEFYAPEAGNYQVQRTTTSPETRRAQWQTIQTIAAMAGAVVTVTDMNATNTAGYYRLSY